MSAFEPNRTLLNPKFEGYKLDLVTQESLVSSFPLPSAHKLSQTAVPAGRQPLSFQEVQSRIKHNHLVVSDAAQAVVYIDAQYQLIAVNFDKTNLSPTFTLLYELPRPIQSIDADTPHYEYPSAAFYGSNLFVSDGHGTLYVFRISVSDNAISRAELINTFELSIPPEYTSSRSSVPFRVHAVGGTSTETFILVLSSRYYKTHSEKSGSSAERVKNAHSSQEFDIWGVNVDTSLISQDQPLSLPIVWHRRGENVPILLKYAESSKSFLFIGSSPYRTITTPTPASYTPTPDEIAPIPRAGENLDDPATQGPPRPPPYSWTQTGDSVTVAFPLPSSTPKDHIRVTLSQKTLTLLVQSSPDVVNDKVPIPRYVLRHFWDGIQPSTSFWTFDREAEHTFGLLTLHLDKQHDGTRWPQVFTALATNANTADDSSEQDIDVPETLDPSELWQIRESLEKYTAALQSGEDTSGLGLGKGVPSLAEGEMDEDVDLDTGDSACVTWVGVDGGVLLWATKDSTVNILSTPLPGSSELSLVAKNGLDGVVYTLAGENPPSWTHSSTFCVLSFVLASKRDTRFVHHLSSKAVFAFDSGASNRGGNVYIYRNTSRSGDQWAKQAVLRIGDGSGGPLLGVGLLRSEDDKPIIVCLCEGEVIVIHGVV